MNPAACYRHRTDPVMSVDGRACRTRMPTVESFIRTVQAWRDLGVVGLRALALIFAVGAMVFSPRPSMCIASGLVFGFIAVLAVLLPGISRLARGQ